MTPTLPQAAAARRIVLVLILVLLTGAAVDPSGLFVPIGWTGHPIGSWWWWAPYLVQVPLLLAIAYVGSRSVLGDASAGAWRRVFSVWAIILLATGLADCAYGAVLLLPMALQKRYVLPAASSAGFVVWSCGYNVLKMALLGWLPAAAGAFPRPAPTLERNQRPAPVADAVLPAGLALVLLALLGPWLGKQWWLGSPLGYAYSVNEGLLAPIPQVSPVHVVLALVLVGAVLLLGLRFVSHARPALRFWSAAAAGVGACMALLLAQCLLLLPTIGRARELWQAPALVVRGLEASSFAVVFALLAALAAGLADRTKSLGARDEAAAATRRLRAGWMLWSLALLIGAGQSWHAAEQSRGTAAESSAATIAPGEEAALRVMETSAGPRLVNAQGALVVLHGVNVNQLGEYFRRDPALPGTLPLAEQDFVDMAALGMNVVRLTLSWSLLEPVPGQISADYLARIRTAVDWAHAHGVYVVLDMHQDGWGVHVDAPAGIACRPGASPMIGWDGAPEWATLADGTDPCQVTGRDMAPNVSRAFQSLYMDRDGIQSHLVRAWAVLAGAFAADSTVVGYDLLNEPNFAETPPIASTLLLANYEARAIAAIRSAEAAAPHGFAHPVFIEPSIFWSGFGMDNLPPRDFTPDTQLVFAPHLYNESITSDQDFGLTFVSIERGYALAQAAARQLDMPLWIGEWGFFKSPTDEAPLLDRQIAAEAADHIGSAFWVWKQSCSDPHVYPGHVAGNLRQWHCPDMREIGTQRAIAGPLSRAALRSTPAPGARLDYTATSVVLHGHWTASGPATPLACEMQLWVPGEAEPREARVEGAHRSEVVRVPSGQASLGASGGWLVRYCLDGGDFRVELPRR